MFAGYVSLASQSPYPIIVYFWANYRPHLSHVLENVIFAISTQSLSIYASTLSRTECNAVTSSLLLNLINYNFLIFLTENLPILNPYFPQNPKICHPILVTLLKMRSHFCHLSGENATPSSGTSPLVSCKGVPRFESPTQYHCFRFQPDLQHNQQSSNCDEISLLLVFTGTETFRSLLLTVVVGILLFM